MILRPPGARPDLNVTRDGRKLHFENRGQSSILLRRLEMCSGTTLLSAEGAGDCEDLPGNRLYAGETWDVELPRDGEVRVYESYRTENKVSRH